MQADHKRLDFYILSHMACFSLKKMKCKPKCKHQYLRCYMEFTYFYKAIYNVYRKWRIRGIYKNEEI